MGVHHHHGPRRAGDQNLVRMGRRQICQQVVGKLGPAMRPGDCRHGAVFSSEVVQHPHGVCHPIALFIQQGAHVAIQRLHPGGMRVRGADIQAAQLEFRAEDVADALQNFRHGDTARQHAAFVPQIGEAPRLLFLLELRSGLLAFAEKQLLDALAQFFQQRPAHEVLQHDIAIAVELGALLWRHRVYCGTGIRALGDVRMILFAYEIETKPMNRYTIAIFLSLLCMASFAQQREKDDHARARDEWFYSQRAYPLGRIPPLARVNAIAEIRRIDAAARQRRQQLRTASLTDTVRGTLDAAPWTSIGPKPTDGGSTYVTAGRVNAIAIDPRDNNPVYIGAAEGGVWKTTDGGANWTALTDDQPSIANGAIALHPNNPDIVYVGTGEENFAQDSYYGAGILKSPDGGKAWTNIVGPFLRAVIGSMAIHPANGQVILLTTSSGIWRSEDGAANWTRVLSGVGTFVLFDPTNGDIAYAALGNTGGSTLNGVYKSTDGGKTWSPSNGSGANAIPSQNTGRISITIANSNTNTLFASIENTAMCSSGRLLGIWKTTDGEQTWNQLH